MASGRTRRRYRTANPLHVQPIEATPVRFECLEQPAASARTTCDPRSRSEAEEAPPAAMDRTAAT